MKKVITNLIVASFIFFLGVFSKDVVSQQLGKQLAQSIKKETLKELQSKFNEKWDKYDVKNGYYLEDGVNTKAPNWKIFKRSEWYWEQRVNAQTGEFPTTDAATEYAKVKNTLKKTNYTESWTNLGTNSSAGGYAGIGRINCVAFHPTDALTFWVGSPSGGIWLTTDGGSNWTILNNNEDVIGVSDIAITNDFATSNTLYIATGDRDGGSIWTLSGGQGADNQSQGVFESTDGGATWNATGLTSAESGAKIYSLIIHPTNNNILIASTSTGIYKTIDGGTNWIKTSTWPVWRLAFKIGDPTVVYGVETYTGDQWFQSSTNTGDTWTDYEIGSGADSRRTELAVTAADPTLVYLLVSNLGGGVNGVYKSTNSGTSFSKVNTNSATEPGMLGYYTDGSGAATGQGSYDWCIAVSPTDANTVFIGGITTWKSIDGGVSWVANNNWTGHPTYNISGAPVVHADKHALVYQPVTNVLFEGNDGGIYKTADGGTTWSDLSNGLVISQLYRIGVSQTSSNTVLTGLQDNGSKLFSGTWSDVKGGDGMECIVDYSNSNYMYATYIRGQITRSINGFTSKTNEVDISANIPGGQPTGDSPTGAWVTPYLIDPNSSSTLFAGYDQVWKTIDRGNNWTSASQQLSATVKLRSLAIAPSNSLVLYAADQSNMWKTTDGGASNWSSITLPSTSTSVTYIAVHPTDPNTLWITYGGFVAGQKVYESTDGGTNWNSISSGLPNLPIMSIVHYKEATTRNVLFVGTDLGVYVKDGPSDWAEYNSGLPSVVVTELDIYYNAGGTDILRAGTYGRGLWETDIDAALPVELTSFAANSVEGSKVSLNWETATEVNNYGFEIERKMINNTQNEENDSWKNIGFIEGSGNSNSPKLYSFVDATLSGGSKFTYRLKQIDIDGSFEYSDLVEIEVIPINFALNQNYPNPFNPTTTISYTLPFKASITLNVYDILGKEVIKLVQETKDAGIYKASFDANNLPSGVYYYTLRAGNFVQTRKMLLLK